MARVADFIKISFKEDKNDFITSFNIENRLIGDFTITFPFQVSEISDLNKQILYTCVGIVLADACLAKKVIFTEGIKTIEKNITDLINFLYEGSKATTERQDIVMPQIIFEKEVVFDIKVKKRKVGAVLGLSGGVDGTYSAVLLKKNKYPVLAITTNVNPDSSKEENKASEEISKYLGIDRAFIKIKFPFFTELSDIYSTHLSGIPDANSTPVIFFGRDLIHIALANIFAEKLNYKYLCMGYEYELYHSTKYFESKKVYLKEIQSLQGSILVNEFLAKVGEGKKFFSPIAGLSKFNYFHRLYETDQQLLKKTIACWYGDSCGKCRQCILRKTLLGYYEPQKAKEVLYNILFAQNYTLVGRPYILSYYVSLYSLFKEAIMQGHESDLERNFGELFLKDPLEISKELLKKHPNPFLPKNFKIE